MHIGTEHGAPLDPAQAAPKPYRASGAHRLWESFTAALPSLGRPVGIAVSTFLMTFVNVLGIPSPCAAAYLAARDTHGGLAVFPLLGLGASLGLRILWGAPLDIWQYMGCLGLWFISLWYRPRTPVGMTLAAGLSMLPRAIFAVVDGNSLGILLACAAVPLSMGLALAFHRGTMLVQDERPMLSFGDKACALTFAFALLAGCGYLRVGSVNLGQLLAVVCVAAYAYTMGSLPGAGAGLMCGLALALCGHSSQLTVHLAIGGFGAGLVSGQKRRWIAALAFMAGHLTVFYLTTLAAPVLSHLSVLLGCVVFVLTGERLTQRLTALGQSTAPTSRSMEGLFVQQRLIRWEGAMRAMAAALPEIVPASNEPPTAEELGSLLCMDCPEQRRCWNEEKPRTVLTLEELMRLTLTYEEPTSQLLKIHDCPCIRVLSVPEALHQIRKSRQEQLAAKAKARFEREMTFTHLDAMASIISEIRALTVGETVSDLQAAFLIGKVIRDLRFPARLCYARRVDGHLQAAIEMDSLLPMGAKPEKLLRYLARDCGLAMGTVRTMKNRVEMEELPLYNVELGAATLCAGQQTLWEEGAVSGDAIAAKQLPGGRFLLLLSDGMGHGGGAHQASNKTLELLLLCLEAGYTRRQAISAVNGMMLSATEGDRFATVDLFDLSLWSGDMQSEKLGACASWLVRGNYLKQVGSSSLPLGIMEDVQPTSQSLRMHSGDILIVMSDGVADVFTTPEQMERAILDSLYIQPQRMADALLRSALLASGGTPRDDMTVVTLLMVDRNRSEAAGGTELM